MEAVGDRLGGQGRRPRRDRVGDLGSCSRRPAAVRNRSSSAPVRTSEHVAEVSPVDVVADGDRLTHQRSGPRHRKTRAATSWGACVADRDREPSRCRSPARRWCPCAGHRLQTATGRRAGSGPCGPGARVRRGRRSRPAVPPRCRRARRSRPPPGRCSSREGRQARCGGDDVGVRHPTAARSGVPMRTSRRTRCRGAVSRSRSYPKPIFSMTVGTEVLHDDVALRDQVGQDSRPAGERVSR